MSININTLTTATHSTVITSNNFYDQRVLTPSNNKRWIIRISWNFELSSVFLCVHYRYSSDVRMFRHDTATTCVLKMPLNPNHLSVHLSVRPSVRMSVCHECGR